MTRPAPAPTARSLVVPGLAALVALAILIGLGTWQLQRKGWKEDLIARIEARSHGEPGAILPAYDRLLDHPIRVPPPVEAAELERRRVGVRRESIVIAVFGAILGVGMGAHSGCEEEPPPSS